MEQYKIAVATSDGENVDLHFGRCRRFTIISVEQESGRWQVEEVRDAPPSPEQSPGHDPVYLDLVSAMLSDCAYLMTSRIGPRPSGALQRHGISVLQISMPVKPAVEKLNEYRLASARRIKNRMER